MHGVGHTRTPQEGQAGSSKEAMPMVRAHITEPAALTRSIAVHIRLKISGTYQSDEAAQDLCGGAPASGPLGRRQEPGRREAEKP